MGGEFVATWGMVTFGGVLFRTTPLSFSMILTSVLLGAGSLLVAAIVKATPEHLVQKLTFELDEHGLREGTDFISVAFSKVKTNLQRSETERLLDSN